MILPDTPVTWGSWVIFTLSDIWLKKLIRNRSIAGAEFKLSFCVVVVERACVKSSKPDPLEDRCDPLKGQMVPGWGIIRVKRGF